VPICAHDKRRRARQSVRMGGWPWRDHVMRRGEAVELDALPPATRQAVTRVQADVRATTDIAWEWMFVNARDPAEPGIECWIGAADGGAYGPVVRWDSDEEDAVLYLADEWSEQVCETLARSDVDLARRWPPCPKPGHGHALDPELRGDRAVWVCRDDRVVIAMIGELATADRGSASES